MKWKLSDPRTGDIIRVLAGQFYHYGIYVDDSEIIQFGPTPDAEHSLLDADIRVCVSDIAGFCKGAFLEVASLSLPERIKAAPAKEVVARARKEIGKGGYDILKNNCEHFVNMCVFGKKSSEQVDSVRAFWQGIPVLDVYVAAQPERVVYAPVEPKERQKELDETNNETVKAQRYFAWQVLCTGLFRSLGLEAGKIDLKRDANRKWISSACAVSLSHCKGAVAAAVSKRPVGVDIEPLDDPRYRQKLIDYIASDAENKMIEGMSMQEGLCKLWTRKEAAFKRDGGDGFVPKKIDATAETLRTIRIRIADREYLLSVAGENLKNLRVYTVTGTDALHATRTTDFTDV